MRVQYLRGIAATLVVLHHVLQPRPWLFSPIENVELGRPGVLIFFVISGFVMLHACSGERFGTFARRRIIRIVPLYWIMTMAPFLLLIQNDIAAGLPFQRVEALIQSFFFIPHYHTVVTDRIWPVLVPGWTLNFEMFFFFIFGLGILAGRVFWLPVTLLIALVAVGALITTENPIILTWTHPYLLLFVFGLAMARSFGAGIDYTWAKVLILPAILLITVAAVAPETAQWSNPVFFIAAILVVAGTLGFEAQGHAPIRPFFARIGDASYSIYLSHTITLFPLMLLMQPLPLHGWAQFLVVSSVSFVVSMLVGLAIWKWLEDPLLKYFLKRPTIPAAP